MTKEMNRAIEVLSQGGVVAFPTETVYGLGADASNPEAIRKIFIIKQRPIDHPLIVHLGSPRELSTWAAAISPEALLLANAFWPGPLTLIFKKQTTVSDLITGGQDTIGLRIPRHPIARELLQRFGRGLAAPSANRFGHISPTTAEAVREELGDAVDCILDGGLCEVGVESTIVDVSGEEVVILRPGMITVRDIEAVLGKQIGIKKKNSPRVSGAMESHYAPTTKTSVMNKTMLTEWMRKEMKNSVVLLTRQSWDAAKNVSLVMMPADSKEYAHLLYETLRRVDKEGFDEIVIEAVPEGMEWDGIRDRLVRMGE